ncbi:hypothetical protein KSP40_PGU011630 [Platanthera guangdongensis]|uniref:RelA/SpoT domain-containing protein n=1 Tax=Platanthera guangdongensis TaxID=2320717 RepID=A0ABR2MU43_9ASPA
MDIHLEGEARESLLQTSPSRAVQRYFLQTQKIFRRTIYCVNIEKLEEAPKKEVVCYHILCDRQKSLYNIYWKMLKKKLNMDEILDIHGVRLVVENKGDCFAALNVVHRL